MLGGMQASSPSLLSAKGMSDPSYSILSLSHTCTLDLPPLPHSMPYKPLAGYLAGHILACYLDYWVYRQHGDKDCRCWSLDLETPCKRWVSVDQPLYSLWYSTSVTVGEKFLIIGGSEEYSDNMEDMSGTVHVQEYSMGTQTWTMGVPLPFPLYEGCAVNTEFGVVALGDFEGGPYNAYILEQDTWSHLPLSVYYHSNPACTEGKIDGEGVIIVLSGQNMEYFSFVQNKWMKMNPPDVARSKNKPPTLGISFNSLVIAGGVSLETVEVSDEYEIWNPLERDWKTKQGLKYSGRADHAQLSLPSMYLQCNN